MAARRAGKILSYQEPKLRYTQRTLYRCGTREHDACSTETGQVQQCYRSEMEFAHGRTPSHGEDNDDNPDKSFDMNYRRQLLHDLEAYKSRIHSNTKLLKHSIAEALDVVMAYDRLITDLGRSLHIRKALIQSEVFWEHWK